MSIGPLDHRDAVATVGDKTSFFSPLLLSWSPSQKVYTYTYGFESEQETTLEHEGLPTFLEAKRIRLMKELGVEHEGSILSVFHRGISCPVLLKEGLRRSRVSVKVLEWPIIWGSGFATNIVRNGKCSQRKMECRYPWGNPGDIECKIVRPGCYAVITSTPKLSNMSRRHGHGGKHNQSAKYHILHWAHGRMYELRFYPVRENHRRQTWKRKSDHIHGSSSCSIACLLPFELFRAAGVRLWIPSRSILLRPPEEHQTTVQALQLSKSIKGDIHFPKIPFSPPLQDVEKDLYYLVIISVCIESLQTFRFMFLGVYFRDHGI